MKYPICLLLLFSFFACKTQDFPAEEATSLPGSAPAVNHAAAAVFTEFLEDARTEHRIPGLRMLVHDPVAGFWAGSTGFARLEDEVAMGLGQEGCPADAFGLAISVAAWQQYGLGVLALETPITEILPSAYTEHLPKAGDITVEHLLRHQSGLPDYTALPNFVHEAFNNLKRELKPEEFLKFFKGQNGEFAPGAEVRYSRTNTYLLALVLEAITEQPHQEIVQQQVLIPAGLTATYYLNEENYPATPAQMNFYFDRRSDGKLENATGVLQARLPQLYGEGAFMGMYDLKLLLENTLNGTLLSQTLISSMQSFTATGKDFAQGAGLQQLTTPFGEAVGVRGEGLGSFVGAWHFPNEGITLILEANVGTLGSERFREALLRIEEDAVVRIYANR